MILASEAARSKVSPLFNPTIPIVVADGTTFPLDSLWHSDRNNWAPRGGFAFRPSASNDFVVRGGYGTFFDLIGYGLASNFTGGPYTRGLDRFVNQITGGQPGAVHNRVHPVLDQFAQRPDPPSDKLRAPGTNLFGQPG